MYISENKIDLIVREEILKEGFKDYAMASLIGLGSMLGGNAYGQDEINANIEQVDYSSMSKQLDNDFWRVKDDLNYNIAYQFARRSNEVQKYKNSNRVEYVKEQCAYFLYKDWVKKYKECADNADIEGLQLLLKDVKEKSKECGFDAETQHTFDKIKKLKMNIARRLVMLQTALGESYYQQGKTLKEGFKEFAMASLIGLGSMLGGNAYGVNNDKQLKQEKLERVYEIEEQVNDEFTDYNTKVALYNELGKIAWKYDLKYANKVKGYLEKMVYDDLVGRYKYACSSNDVSALKDLLHIVKQFNADCNIKEGKMERLAYNIARRINLLRTYNEDYSEDID